MRLSIIDRRLAGKNKSIGNRERFLRRHGDQIREAVKRAVSGRGIRDIEQGEDIALPRRDVSEPVFRHGDGGLRETVHPGNREYLKGDRIQRPAGGQGGPGSQASDSGEGEDDFVFHLSKEEFMQVFFEDLALPNLVKTRLAEVPEFKTQRAGFTSDGTPGNLHVLRSLRGAIGRRVAIGGDARRELRQLEAQLASLGQHAHDHAERPDPGPDGKGLDLELDPGDELRAQAIRGLQDRTLALRERLGRIPYLDPFDLRYRNRVRVPMPTTRLVRDLARAAERSRDLKCQTTTNR